MRLFNNFLASKKGLYDRCLQAVYESEEQAELNTETSCIELEEFNQLVVKKFTDD